MVRTAFRLGNGGSYLLSYLFGAALITPIATVWSFWQPVTPMLGLVFCLIGVVAVAAIPQCRSQWISDFQELTQLSWPYKTFLIVGLLACLTGALRTVDAFDEGLYYIPTIKWLQAYGTVNGLANLHIRLGYNSSWHVLAAAFTFFQPTYLNELGISLMLATICYVVPKLEVALTSRKVDQMSFLLLWLFLLTNTFPKANSLSSDFPTFTILFYLGYRLLQNATDVRAYHLEASCHYRELFFLLAYLLILKLSTVLPALVLVALGLSKLDATRVQVRQFIQAVALAAFVFLPSVVRSWFLSGFAVVPLGFTAIGKPDWAVPAEVVDYEKTSIELSAKLYEGQYPPDASLVEFGQWFPHWYQVTGLDIVMPVVLGLVAAIAIVLSKAHNRVQKMASVGLAVVLLYMIIQIPDLRFIYALPWLLVAMAVSVLLRQVADKLLFRLSYLMMLVQGITFITIMIDCYRHSDTSLLTASLAPVTPTRVHQLDAKTSVLIPKEGDQCWDAPLTCTPDYAVGRITLRGNTLADGFKPVMDK